MTDEITSVSLPPEACPDYPGRTQGRSRHAAARTSSIEFRLAGVALSPGVAMGRVCFYEPAGTRPSRPTTAAVTDEERLRDALEWLTQRQEQLAQDAESNVGAEAAEIFHAYKMILEGPSLRQRLFAAIRDEGMDAEDAVTREFNEYKSQLQASGTRYMRDRVTDLSEIQMGLLNRLRRASPHHYCRDRVCPAKGQCGAGVSHVVVARELTSTLPMEMDAFTEGFLVEQGGRDTHAGILVRALGIPAVSGVKQLARRIARDAQLLIDGYTGEVIVNPSEYTLRRYKRVAQSPTDADSKS